MEFGAHLGKLLLIGVVAMLIIGPDVPRKAAEAFAQVRPSGGEYLRDTRSKMLMSSPRSMPPTGASPAPARPDGSSATRSSKSRRSPSPHRPPRSRFHRDDAEASAALSSPFTRSAPAHQPVAVRRRSDLSQLSRTGRAAIAEPAPAIGDRQGVRRSITCADWSSGAPMTTGIPSSPPWRSAALSGTDASTGARHRRPRRGGRLVIVVRHLSRTGRASVPPAASGAMFSITPITRWTGSPSHEADGDRDLSRGGLRRGHDEHRRGSSRPIEMASRPSRAACR